VFSELHARYLNSRTFPDLERVYRRLGLRDTDGTLRLDDDAPDRAVREAIMGQPGSGP
jgi:hypothetical protein